MQAALIGDLESAVQRGTVSFPDPRLSTSPVRISRMASGIALPLLIEPSSSNVDLGSWLTAHRDELESWLREAGGILFRGFGIASTETFETLIASVSGRLLDYSYRSTPRTVISGKIYTSTEYPPHQTIPLHNENAYAHDWPMKIWFFSRECAATGGETPIADSRAVYRRVPAAIRERFEHKRLMYVRNYGTGFDLPWQEVFQTTDKSQVERFCRATGIQLEWLGNDRLRTRQVCQAVAQHPMTGDMIWFNQAHLFHVSRLPAEVREAMLTIFPEEDLPRNVYFGDGSEIDSDDLDCVCEAYEAERVVFPWLTGDVLLLDNMLTAHARNPFTGKRQVVVGMAEPYSEKR